MQAPPKRGYRGTNLSMP